MKLHNQKISNQLTHSKKNSTLICTAYPCSLLPHCINLALHLSPFKQPPRSEQLHQNHSRSALLPLTGILFTLAQTPVKSEISRRHPFTNTAIKGAPGQAAKEPPLLSDGHRFTPHASSLKNYKPRRPSTTFTFLALGLSHHHSTMSNVDGGPRSDDLTLIPPRKR